MKPQNARYNCALDAAMSVIEGRWKCTIICMLALDGSLRFSELQKRIGEITSRILSKQLKELESDGMVRRSVSCDGKLKVEYDLTDKGRSLLPILVELAKWGVDNQCLQVIVPHEADLSQTANLDRDGSATGSVELA